MGRPTKDYNDKKINISISLEKEIYYRIVDYRSGSANCFGIGI